MGEGRPGMRRVAALLADEGFEGAETLLASGNALFATDGSKVASPKGAARNWNTVGKLAERLAAPAR